MLFLADTHLGFDYPLKPRIERRRRGDDFFGNYHRALDLVGTGEVDAVVHGGDLFDRSRIPASVLHSAFEPLVAIADSGVPVFIVPGNHERSVIPNSLFALHDDIVTFGGPREVIRRIGSLDISWIGFPFERHHIRRLFPQIVEPLISGGCESFDARLLCMHQTVETAQVGAADFTFRNGPDVIPRTEIGRLSHASHLAGFDVVLSGHIHRRQVIDPYPRRITTTGKPGPDWESLQPGAVVYPGAIERTSFDERYEEKGVVLLEIEVDDFDRAPHIRQRFVALPSRPMVVVELSRERISRGFTQAVRERLAGIDSESIVKIRIPGDLDSDSLRGVSERVVRAIAPATMNVSLSFPRRIPARNPSPRRS